MALRTTRADLDNAVARLHNAFGREVFALYRESGKVKLVRCEGRGAEDVLPLSSASSLEWQIHALVLGIRLGRGAQ
jgi:hypothetical protein